MAYKWTTNKTGLTTSELEPVRGSQPSFLMRVTIHIPVAQIVRRSAAELIAEILIIHPPSDIGARLDAL